MVPYLDPFEGSMASLLDDIPPMECPSAPWVRHPPRTRAAWSTAHLQATLVNGELEIKRCRRAKAREIVHDYDHQKKKVLLTVSSVWQV